MRSFYYGYWSNLFYRFLGNNNKKEYLKVLVYLILLVFCNTLWFVLRPFLHMVETKSFAQFLGYVCSFPAMSAFALLLAPLFHKKIIFVQSSDLRIFFHSIFPFSISYVKTMIEDIWKLKTYSVTSSISVSMNWLRI